MKLDLITNKAEKQGEVNPNDEFYTPNYAIEPLLKYIKPIVLYGVLLIHTKVTL